MFGIKFVSYQIERTAEEKNFSCLAGTKKMNILLVEDDPAVRKMTINLLQHLDCKVVAVEGAHDAIRIIKEQNDGFDLVLTDYSMPDMDGIELAMHLKRIIPGMPVILCTGIDSSNDPDMISGTGVSEILTKPYTKNELDLSIRRATAR